MRFLVLLLLALATFASAQPLDPKVIDLRDLPPLQSIIPTLAEKRVVFVGEIHDRYAHHLTQLAVVRALHARHPDLAIGAEFFQQPFQGALDEYINGSIDEKTMLKRTEYLDRWRFDYRLYRPILRYARENGIPVIALNVSAELSQKVGQVGIDALSEEEKAQLPEMPEASEAYRTRLKTIYEAHPQREGGGNFDHFVQAQLLWDEGMAERAARFLHEHPQRPLVVLAGAGHLAYGIGIPERVARRVDAPMAVLINDPPEELTEKMADFVLLTEPQPLPPKGRLGVMMLKAEDGVAVEKVLEKSAADEMGIRPGDRLVRIGDESVRTPAEVTLAMMDRVPGDQLEVEVVRESWFGGEERIVGSVTLQ